MFIGEALCYLIFYFWRRANEEEYRKELKKAKSIGLETHINLYIVIIPTSLDLITSTLAFFALQFMPTSMY
jgi:hypothetical protein